MLRLRVDGGLLWLEGFRVPGRCVLEAAAVNLPRGFIRLLYWNLENPQKGRRDFSTCSWGYMAICLGSPVVPSSAPQS